MHRKSRKAPWLQSAFDEVTNPGHFKFFQLEGWVPVAQAANLNLKWVPWAHGMESLWRAASDTCQCEVTSHFQWHLGRCTSDPDSEMAKQVWSAHPSRAP